MESSRSSSPAGSAPRPSASTFDPERFYRQLPYPYRREYAPLLQLHPEPDIALAELALFHFWLAVCVYRLHRCGGSPDEARAPLPPGGWHLPDRAEDIVVDQALGGTLTALLESRSDLYQRFFRLGRHEQDPQGLKAVSLALACQLFEDPSPTMRAWLHAKVERLFAEISRSCADGVGTAAPPSP
ncbi:MAG TPA: hypothetical protein VFF96_07015 [Pseudoxanthomonas sp.]|nr:hypothetical protein [Pseudoxanthomonas sp.]